MATTATSISDWTGRINGGVEYSDTVAGLPEPSDDQTYKREIYVMTRHRYLQDVTSFNPQGGDEAVGSTLTIKSGGDTLTAPSTIYFLCSQDILVPTAEGIDVWKEEQIWQASGSWALYTPTTTP